MQKTSIKKLSILGLVLMAASAVTAAIVPNRSESNLQVGSLTASSLGGATKSCKLTDAATAPCTATASATTGSGQDDSTVGGDPNTANNTTGA